MDKKIIFFVTNLAVVVSLLHVNGCQVSASDSLLKYKARFKYYEEWNGWKRSYRKSYDSVHNELEHHLIWLSNRKFIEQHNANEHIFGFTLAMNHWGDMTDAEYLEKHRSYSPPDPKLVLKFPVYKAPQNVSYADSLDWRTKGAVGSVKDQMQYQCGCSYAFSAMGALEGATALAKGTFTALSEQNIVDCSVPFGNYGCSGGNMYNSFMYVIANGGVTTQNSYPYIGRQYECQYKSSNKGADMSGIVPISTGDEDKLLAAVYNIGPVSVAVDASSNAFRYYSGGVFDSSRCSSNKGSLTHSMLVTGYGTSNGKDYWLVKNSWSSNWGMNGYILMTRGNYNQCGIATDASYPTL